ncbi:MAG: hypothetical protein AAGH65_04115 [Pseudomonadota bacterium]
MTNKLPDPLEQMQADWQQTETPPVNVDALKRRLHWRWLHAGIDGLGLVIAWVVLGWATTFIAGVLEWVYWGFFFAMLVAATVSTVQMRRRSLWRSDDSIQSVIEHAQRDAALKVQAGRLTIWMTLAILIFVAAWMLVAGVLDAMPLMTFLGQRTGALGFAALWCLMAMAFGGWMRERGLRQQMEVDRLQRELLE